MDAAGYAALARQSSLMREMQVVANNVANAATTGFRREGVVFAEHVDRLAGAASLSSAHARGRYTDLGQGTLARTGGTFDLAIEGEGFFLIATPEGNALTRAGAFLPGPEGELVTPEGDRLLDAGGAPVFVPPDARAIAIGPDGTLAADGQPLGVIGLWQPSDPLDLQRAAGARFHPAGEVEPVEAPRIRQGALEDSNVEPVTEIARMIEVQRAYELGQGLLDREDERIRAVIRSLGR
jgi:flagellar basal-body rod protein FlgF